MYRVNAIHFQHFYKKKGISVPLQARSGPEGSRKLRFPDFMTTAQDGGNDQNYLYRWLPCQLFYTTDDGRMTPETCRESLQ